MFVTLNEYGTIIAENSNEFYKEFPELEMARIVHACLLAHAGFKLDSRRTALLFEKGLAEVAE